MQDYIPVNPNGTNLEYCGAMVSMREMLKSKIITWFYFSLGVIPCIMCHQVWTYVLATFLSVEVIYGVCKTYSVMKDVAGVANKAGIPAKSMLDIMVYAVCVRYGAKGENE